MHRISATGLCTTLVMLLLAACSSTATSSPQQGTDGGPLAPAQDSGVADVTDAMQEAEAGSCPLPGRLGSPLCEQCLSARCCDVIVACSADTPCATVLSCARKCLLDSAASAAGACIDDCVAATPSGREKYQAFDTCIAAPPPQGCAYDCS